MILETELEVEKDKLSKKKNHVTVVNAIRLVVSKEF